MIFVDREEKSEQMVFRTHNERDREKEGWEQQITAKGGRRVGFELALGDTQACQSKFIILPASACLVSV